MFLLGTLAQADIMRFCSSVVLRLLIHVNIRTLPGDIVRHVLSALRDDPTMGGKVVVEHASDRNRFKRCSPEILLQWLSTSEFKYLLDVSSFFVAPMPSYTRDRRRCIVSCVVNTSMDAKHGLSFNIALDSNEVWKIDSVFPS